jgi:hypothetical protein
LAGPLFLCPEQAASKSVASISATESRPLNVRGNSGSNRRSLIRRSPVTPTRWRKSFNIHTSGTAWRLAKWANWRQAFCSGNIWTNRLNECTGVSKPSRCRRHNWAGRSRARRPRPPAGGNSSLMKASGMWGDSSESSAAVPVWDSREFMRQRTTQKLRLRPMKSAFSQF